MKRKIIQFFLVLAVFAVLYFVFHKATVVAKVQCTSEEHCGTEVRELLEKQKGKGYLTAKRDLNIALSVNPKIKGYEISFHLPSTLYVSVEQKRPVIGLKFGEARYFLFDENASLVEEVGSTNLPIVTVLGILPDNELMFGVKMAHLLFQYYSSSDIKIDHNGLYADIPGKAEVNFPLSGEVDVILGSLEAVLSQLNHSPQNHTITIDLRYKNPVVFGI